MTNGKSENLIRLLTFVAVIVTLGISIAILLKLNQKEGYTAVGDTSPDVCTDQQKSQGCFSYCKGGASGPVCDCVSSPGVECGASVCSDDELKKGCFVDPEGMCSQKCKCGSSFYCATKLEGTDDCILPCGSS